LGRQPTAYADLVSFGCDVAQGFYMSRPIPAAELDEWLASRELAPIAAGHEAGSLFSGEEKSLHRLA